jgi:23S rRNA (cytosine1962-C5)-methyltransferase
MSAPALVQLLDQSIAARQGFLKAPHDHAFRLFNGFTEGYPELVVDLYAATAIFNNYASSAREGRWLVDEAQEFLRTRLPWLRAGILKARNSPSPEEKRGKLLFGGPPDEKIQEHAVWYAVDLTLNRDASFYLDTRNLRRWALDHLKGKTVLNTFAYTGSLGVAAVASGASRVVQLDRNSKFLKVARRSYALNGFAARAGDFIQADFFRYAARLRRQPERFDCVFIDPPYFASSSTGIVDQVHDSARLINKVRPLVNDGGFLVAVNNSLYVSGTAYMQTLQALCADGYLRLVQLIPVPDDCLGYSEVPVSASVADPAPFNHSTKIAVLEVPAQTAQYPKQLAKAARDKRPANAA